MTEQADIGIRSTGVYLPANYLDASDIARESGLPLEVVKEKLGIHRKPVPGPEDHTVEMGVKAARRALEKGGIDPGEIDLVIYIGEEYKEHPVQTGATRLQEGIGAGNAWGFDIQLRCGTMVLGIKVARDMMTSDQGLNTVLLAGGYRNVDLINYRNPRVRFMYSLAAGGAAVVLQKGLGRNRVLGSHVITDPSLAASVGVVAGGTRVPLTPEALAKGLYALEVFDPEEMKNRLEEVSMPNFIRVIEKALEHSGHRTEDIGYLCILHMKKSAHDYILSRLGLDPGRAIYLSDYGHIGQIDQVLSLELALERGLVKDGDLVVMVSAGVGYAWVATAVKWGGD